MRVVEALSCALDGATKAAASSPASSRHQHPNILEVHLARKTAAMQTGYREAHGVRLKWVPGCQRF
jgi:hypothetical protein